MEATKESATPLNEGVASVMQQRPRVEPASSTLWPKHNEVPPWRIDTPRHPQLCQDTPEPANCSDIMRHTIDNAATTILTANPRPRSSQMGTNDSTRPITCASTIGDPQEASRM